MIRSSYRTRAMVRLMLGYSDDYIADVLKIRPSTVERIRAGYGGTEMSTMLLKAVEQALPLNAPGLSPREVRKKVAGWSAATIRNALYQLVRDGRARFEGRPGEYRYMAVPTWAVIGLKPDGEERVLLTTGDWDTAASRALAEPLSGWDDLYVRRV